ncbi:MAG TPA: glycosyltransferase family 4 protein [Xanthobacteraceae bacterium]|nr:glycosyltransferase family 4 protein [Xanthobacteraceae bacterium]
MVRHLAFAVPGDLATPTGGYAYDRRIIEELRALGWTVDVIDLGDGFPNADAALRAAAAARLRQAPVGCPVVIDGLALGALPEAAAALHARNPLVALVHHPLALESGLPAAEAEKFRASERAALSFARRVIVTSPATARVLAADYDVPPERITVAPPGSDPAAPAPGSTDGIVRLLAVGSLVPRKGYDVLIAALARVADLPWRLTIAGDARDPATAMQINRQIAALQLTPRIAVLGAVPAERLAGLYAAADLFVLASRYEGYGMAFADAIAHGLPVIGTTGGAVPDTVPEGTGILVAPDDVAALAEALRRLIGSRDARGRLAAAARAAAARLPTWKDSARLFADAIEAAA